MERSAIRSVAFGGFDKEDVARYIEQLSQETEKLREERDALQEKADCLEKEADELRTQVQELTKAREELSAEMARLAPLEKECPVKGTGGGAASGRGGPCHAARSGGGYRVRGPAAGSRAGGAHGGTDAQGAGPLPAAVPDFDEHI